MRIRVHRGTRQIGGTCIEVEAQGRRIVLDLGLPLDQEDSADLLPPVAGFREPDATLLGVVLSHAHQDHYGLARHLPASVPLYLGDAAARILAASAPFVPGGVAFEPAGFLRDRMPLGLGPFTLTPYLMDHSAYDAYALLVEADGQRVFYTGDLRAHGKKAALFERLVREPPRDVDVLLMEGTTLGREGAEARYPTEREVEQELVAASRGTSGLLLVQASSQNIDRIVALFRACKRTGRVLIVDLYAAAVLAATGNPRIPQSHWPEMRLWLPQRQRVQVKEQALFDLLGRHASNRIYPEHLPVLAPRAALLFRAGMLGDLERAGCLKGARLIYSLWPGYLEQDGMQRMLRRLEHQGIPLQYIHTSGHASPADLRRLAEALAPGCLVPIHTEHPERYTSLYPTVTPQDDGAWWEV